MNDLFRNLLLWVLVAAVLMVVFQSLNPNKPGVGQEIPYSQFIDQVRRDQVRKVDIASDEKTIEYETKGGLRGVVIAPRRDEGMMNDLINHNVDIRAEPPDSGNVLWALLLNFLPVILIIGFWFFMMRQMQGGGGRGAMGFGRSRAKLLNEDQTKATFADVAGCDEAKEEVSELVEFLRDPSRFQKLGGKIPRGVLMVGPPGTGSSPRRLQARPRCRFSRSRVLILSKCLSASVPAACATCSSRPKNMHRALFSSMKSMPWAAIAVPVSAAGMTSASRPSTSYWSKWTALKAAKA